MLAQAVHLDSVTLRFVELALRRRITLQQRLQLPTIYPN